MTNMPDDDFFLPIALDKRFSDEETTEVEGAVATQGPHDAQAERVRAAIEVAAYCVHVVLDKRGGAGLAYTAAQFFWQMGSLASQHATAEQMKANAARGVSTQLELTWRE